MNFESSRDQNVDFSAVFVSPEAQRKEKLKTTVMEVFQHRPELAAIGTIEEYMKYLETVFPDSTFKEIFQHQTKNEFDQFSDDILSSGRMGEGHYFSNLGNDYSTNQTIAKKFVVLDIKNEKHIQGGGYMKMVYDLLEQRGLSPDDKEEETKVEREVTEALKKEYDALVGDKNGKLESEIMVFSAKQINVLGSLKDIVGFKRFVEVHKTS